MEHRGSKVCNMKIEIEISDKRNKIDIVSYDAIEYRNTHVMIHPKKAVLDYLLLRKIYARRYDQ